tara:strand:- start:972 stop:1673 length:702 start_codon:yes stop_codon:yes gene_type:complete
MAGTELRQDNITLNLGSGGPDVATDFISSFGVSGGHMQIVKVAYGGDGQSNLVTTANAFPVRIYGLDPTFETLPVAGNTMGGAINVTGTFGVGSVAVTFDAATVDIRSVDAGVTFGVQNAAGTTLDISGSSVVLSSVVLPSSLTFGTKRIEVGASAELAGFSCETGIKIKNFAGFTAIGSGFLGVGGPTYDGSATADAFLLQTGEEIFIEINDVDKLVFAAFLEPVTLTYQAT